MEAKTIREAVETRSGLRYDPDLKLKILAYVHRRRAEGAPQKTVAAEVGVSWMTLRRWLDDATSQSSARLVPVDLVEPAQVLALVTPRGFRLEGLTPRQALELLRHL